MALLPGIKMLLSRGFVLVLRVSKEKDAPYASEVSFKLKPQAKQPRF